MNRRAFVTALLPVASGVLITVAVSGNYCGHSSTGNPITGERHFVYTWVDSQGRHRHNVQVSQVFRAPRYENPVCPRHR